MSSRNKEPWDNIEEQLNLKQVMLWRPRKCRNQQESQALACLASTLVSSMRLLSRDWLGALELCLWIMKLWFWILMIMIMMYQSQESGANSRKRNRKLGRKHKAALRSYQASGRRQGAKHRNHEQICSCAIAHQAKYKQATMLHQTLRVCLLSSKKKPRLSSCSVFSFEFSNQIKCPCKTEMASNDNWGNVWTEAPFALTQFQTKALLLFAAATQQEYWWSKHHWCLVVALNDRWFKLRLDFTENFNFDFYLSKLTSRLMWHPLS